MAKPLKPKAVNYELIARDSVVGHPLHCLLDELVDLHHGELRQARIALAWCLSFKVDVDGNFTVVKTMRASDLHRELAPYDVVILLARTWWLSDTTTPQERRYALDFGLCSVTEALDKTGEPAIDARDRRVFRSRKPNYTTFTELIERYGLEITINGKAAAEAIRRAAAAPFTPCAQCRDAGTPGWVSIVDNRGVQRQTRCACYLQWADLRAEAKSEAVPA
jgi:hypothetical protein